MDFEFSADYKCRMLLRGDVFSLSWQSTHKTDGQGSGSVVIDGLDGPDPCLDKPLRSPVGIGS